MTMKTNLQCETQYEEIVTILKLILIEIYIVDLMTWFSSEGGWISIQDDGRDRITANGSRKLCIEVHIRKIMFM